MSENADNQIENMQINFAREDFVGTGVTGLAAESMGSRNQPRPARSGSRASPRLGAAGGTGLGKPRHETGGERLCCQRTAQHPRGVFTPNSAIQQSVVTLVQFSKNIQISIIKVVVEGNRYAIRWDWMERDALTGAPHFSNDMLCGELDSTGKILFKREYFDVYRQFELTPVFPASPQ